jgi:hypothetical protein
MSEQQKPTPEEYEQRAAKFAKAFTAATGIKTEVGFSSIDGRTILIMSPNSTPENATKIIDSALIPFRKEQGLDKDALSFSEGRGQIHSFIKNPKAEENQVLLYLPGTPNDTVDGKIHKALENGKAHLKANISTVVPVKTACTQQADTFGEGAPYTPMKAPSGGQQVS